MEQSTQWRSHSFTVGRARSGLLTALIGYLNVLLEYFDFSNFHWQGTINIWVGLGPVWPTLGYAPESTYKYHRVSHLEIVF